MSFGPNGRTVTADQMQRWMSHPLVHAVLSDPLTGQMLSALQKDQDVFPKICKDRRIEILICAGILEVPPKYRADYSQSK